MSNNSKYLIVVHVVRKVIEIFLGPFLMAYLFKISTDSITTVSLYNIFAFVVIGILAVLVGSIIKNRYEMLLFRFGMIFKLLQLIILVAIGKRIVKYIWLVAILSGASTITWYFPLNLFSSTLVQNNEKKEFTIYKTILSNLVCIILPVVFGSIIDNHSFEKTAIIVLGLSIIQLFVSFRLDYKSTKTTEKRFKLMESYKKLRKNKDTRELFINSFFWGITKEGALNTSVTLLIIITFSKDFSLGVVTSITYLLSMISAYISKKLITPDRMKYAIYISCIIPLLGTVMLLFITNKYTIVGYNLVYAFFIQIVEIMKEYKTLKITNSTIINDSNRVEAYVLIEMFLGFGRVISFVLLLLVGLSNSLFLLKILIMCLTLCLLFSGIHLTEIEVDS